MSTTLTMSSTLKQKHKPHPPSLLLLDSLSDSLSAFPTPPTHIPSHIPSPLPSPMPMTTPSPMGQVGMPGGFAAYGALPSPLVLKMPVPTPGVRPMSPASRGMLSINVSGISGMNTLTAGGINPPPTPAPLSPLPPLPPSSSASTSSFPSASPTNSNSAPNSATSTSFKNSDSAVYATLTPSGSSRNLNGQPFRFPNPSSVASTSAQGLHEKGLPDLSSISPTGTYIGPRTTGASGASAYDVVKGKRASLGAGTAGGKLDLWAFAKSGNSNGEQRSPADIPSIATSKSVTPLASASTVPSAWNAHSSTSSSNAQTHIRGRSRSSSLSNSIASASASVSHSHPHPPESIDYFSIPSSSTSHPNLASPNSPATSLHSNPPASVSASATASGYPAYAYATEKASRSGKKQRKDVRDSAASLLSLDMAVRALNQIAGASAGGGKESSIRESEMESNNGAGDALTASSPLSASTSALAPTSASASTAGSTPTPTSSATVSALSPGSAASTPSASGGKSMSTGSSSRSTSSHPRSSSRPAPLNATTSSTTTTSPPLSPAASSTFSHASGHSGSGSERAAMGRISSAAASAMGIGRPPDKPLPPPPMTITAATTAQVIKDLRMGMKQSQNQSPPTSFNYPATLAHVSTISTATTATTTTASSSPSSSPPTSYTSVSSPPSSFVSPVSVVSPGGLSRAKSVSTPKAKTKFSTSSLREKSPRNKAKDKRGRPSLSSLSNSFTESGKISPDIDDMMQSTPRPSRSLSRPQSGANMDNNRVSRASSSFSVKSSRSVKSVGKASTAASADGGGTIGRKKEGPKRRASSPGRYYRFEEGNSFGVEDIAESSFRSEVSEDYGVPITGPKIGAGGRGAFENVNGNETETESELDLDNIERALLDPSASRRTSRIRSSPRSDEAEAHGGPEDGFEEEMAEDANEGTESDSGSSIDLHTPLPNIMLREGVLSPNSKLLGGIGHGGRESVASNMSTMSMTSNMTASGLFRDERDTTKRRVRHRDGNLLRDGRGLTTGLGWSDSEDEDAPSPLTRRISKLTLSRNSSMTSMRSFSTASTMSMNPTFSFGKPKGSSKSRQSLRSVRSLPQASSSTTSLVAGMGFQAPHPSPLSKKYQLDEVEENDEGDAVTGGGSAKDGEGPWTAPPNAPLYPYSSSISGSGTVGTAGVGGQVVNYSLPLLPRDQASASLPLSSSTLSKKNSLQAQSHLEPPVSYKSRSRSPTPTSTTTSSSTSYGFPGTPLDSTGELSEDDDTKQDTIKSKKREAYVDDGQVVSLDAGIAVALSIKPTTPVAATAIIPATTGNNGALKSEGRVGGSGGARSKTPTAMRMRTIPGARNRALSASAGVPSPKYRSSSENERDGQSQPQSSPSPPLHQISTPSDRMSTASSSSQPSSVPRPLRLPSLLYTQPSASASSSNLQPGQPEKKHGQLLQGYNRNLHDSQRKRTLSQGSAMAKNDARNAALKAGAKSASVPLPTPSPTIPASSNNTTPELGVSSNTGTNSKIARPTIQKPQSSSSSLPSPAPSPVPSPSIPTKPLTPRTGTGMTYRTSSLPTSKNVTGNIQRIKSGPQQVSSTSGIARKVST